LTEYPTATDLAAALAARRCSAVELVDHAVARIDALDTQLNAVVVRDFAQARLAAEAADAALARGEKRPLLGLPMTVKEALNVAGMPTTWGMKTFRDWCPTEDAAAVERVKAAGAIILGKTNVPMGMDDWQAYNDLYGTTNNPWDTGHTPGGSSGGAAAALAAGYVPLEIGSDVAGSLRVPAHFCGVYAHNPSRGLVPVRGHVPPTTPVLPRESDLMVVGPMARTAADLELLLEAIAGPDTPMAAGYRLALPPARHDDLRQFRVLVIDTHPLLPVAANVTAAIARLSDRLAPAVGKFARASDLLPDLARNARAYTLLLSSYFGADLLAADYARARQAADELAADDDSLRAHRIRGRVLNHRDWIRADRVREAQKHQWRALFREWDVVVCPIMPTPAFPHDHSPPATRRIVIDGRDYAYSDQLAWAGVATLPGLPATAMPIGFSETGLPIGVQVLGPFLEDRTTIAFAGLVERAFGGFVAPPFGDSRVLGVSDGSS
jgi:amidase